MRFLLLLLLLLGLFVRASQAQQSPAERELSLQQARHLAEQVSPELASARAVVRAAEGRARQSGAFPNPIASYSREQTSGSGIETSQDIVALEQALELGGQRGARRAAAKQLMAASEARLAAARSQLAYEVTGAYAQAVATDRRAALTEQAAQAFGEAGRVGRERLAAGDISGYEHRRIRLESARYAALRAEAGLARAKARRTLATLLSAPDRPVKPQALLLTDTMPGNPLQVSGDSMVRLALAHRPELVALEREVGAAEAEARLARAERIPTPTFGGGYKREQAPGGGSLDGYTAQLSLPLPLWDRRGGAVQAADAETERSQAGREAFRRRTELEVLEAYDAFQVLGDQLNALGSRIQEDARPGIRAAQAAYREGETSLVEWLDAVRAFHEAESSYAALAAEQTLQRAMLERLTGLTLF
jgi:cobalt-zinc-cadmium efflux system outer membrane protein